MTLSEIAVACEDPEAKEGTDLTDADVMNYARWWHSLTPRERLWAES